MKIQILSTAMADLYYGRIFYERQGKGLGDYFSNTLFSDIDSLKLYAGIHSIHFGNYRMLSKRFPYAVYYMMEGDSMVIVRRVLDLRRNPGIIRSAMQKFP